MPRPHPIGKLLTASSAGLALALALAMAPGLAGCGGEPGLVKVTGRVTYKGRPVSKGQVYFTPEKGGRAADSALDSDGNYRLGTFDLGDGAYAGSYQVSVVSRGEDKAPPTGKRAKAVMEEDMQGTGEPLIPRRYFSPESSNLKAEVAADRSSNFDFELTD
ncbi:carboxypeptidase regulatory-like domain-containing protein [Planctomyces sp. SH-PL62]|uniref:carboxypeptidase regulatory-like domain-containing protein n=1 Tax=Planctomyces sp. SH-PL62 TaxID=1636152 RepID=UPI00078DF266|nr:carboxypeptidase regulatory-like domain-containing protein [Planctomyces sp. SH-PL62]AMV40305.1 hypothetical protein VT85_22935 [Planctomyces sp. SH-PL62]